VIWGTIELMGHRQHHGLVTEVSFAGVQMIRVQVPHPQKSTDSDGAELFAETHLYSPSALYGLHETSEDEVRTRIERLAPVYYLSANQLPESTDGEDERNSDGEEPSE